MTELDIQGLTERQLRTVWPLINQVLAEVTLRDAPSFVRDAGTQVETATWSVNFTGLKAFLWGLEMAEEPVGVTSGNTDMPARVQNALIRRMDTPALAAISEAAELVIGDEVWKVHMAETPPGNAIWILRLRR